MEDGAEVSRITTDNGLTVERLREALDYDPSTGVFVWRISSTNRVPAGSVAGTVDANGYRVIQLDRVLRRAHRLAWLYVYGRWPVGELDHRFGAKDDNRVSQLREVTRTENTQNRHAPARNALGVIGVRKHACGKYEPRITLNGKLIYLGLFATLEAAVEVRRTAKMKHHLAQEYRP